MEQRDSRRWKRHLISTDAKVYKMHSINLLSHVHAVLLHMKAFCRRPFSFSFSCFTHLAVGTSL